MNCKRAKQELALSAGLDLDALTEQELQRHLANCPECFDQWNRVRGTTSMLQQVAADELVSSDPPQLWSSLSQLLPQKPQRRTASHRRTLTLSNTVIPVVALASLTFAVFSIHQSLEESALQSSASNGFQLSVESANHALQDPDSTSYPESYLKFDSASLPLDMRYQAPVDVYRESKPPKVDSTTQPTEDSSLPSVPKR